SGLSVKNKAPAEVQITAEQLLREAKERELELLPPPPKQKITDEEELNDYKLKKRKGFEDNIRKNRTVISNWIKYAQWEESLKEILRARSIYERALDVDHRNITLWLKYAEMEMKSRQVNHARNIWDRAITILPRVNQFWYKYTYMEEMLGNVAGCRQAFERWMEWEPEEQAWHSYINFELRYKEVDKARTIYERYILLWNWIKYARFEEKHGYIAHSRKVFERAVEFFGEEYVNENLFVAFARFEEAQKEMERVRVIYKYALDRIPKQQAQELFKNYTMFEKKFGDRRGIEDVIVSKRRFQYEEEVKANPHNYDAWFDYLRLVESDADPDTVREVYERAIANIPPIQEKRHWRRYIYLWINYALYEELEVKDPETTRQVYQACLDLMPHKKFTFAKIWLLYAQFEIRQKNLQGARKVMGTAIGKCPKNKLLKGYIELELQLREFDRCRKLYEKYLEFSPENCTTWIKFSELETILGDVERARGIFELAIGQPRLDMPEVLWKSYIDFEIEQEDFGNTRNLYKRLLQRTQHVKVWISYAKFELSIDGGGDRLQRCRQIFEEANKGMRSCEEKEERLMLLESWREFEREFGSDSTEERVEKLLPEKVKKRRKLTAEDGSDAGWEEYYDYIFPEDAANQPNLKLLAMAKMWKRQQVETDEEKLPENGATDEETPMATSPPPLSPPSPSTREPATTPPEKQPEKESDRNTEAEREGEKKHDDRDDSSSSSSSSSESDSDDGEKKKIEEEEKKKESRSNEEDKD
uniref:Crooked neck-like protein 1 n=1 Tax=Scophthalmus maximus TaxID=52904 RepID=A0A8D3DJR6_SCOMX